MIIIARVMQVMQLIIVYSNNHGNNSFLERDFSRKIDFKNK